VGLDTSSMGLHAVERTGPIHIIPYQNFWGFCLPGNDGIAVEKGSRLS
jgi:hypothetical protein